MNPPALEIVVNGALRSVRAGCTLAELVALLGMAGRRLAVAVNRDIVPRGSYGRVLASGDRIEILEAVGGG